MKQPQEHRTTVHKLPRLTGFGFYWIRKEAGYSRTEFSRWLTAKKREQNELNGAASKTALQKLEAEKEVGQRYVRLLKEFVKADVFNGLVERLQKKYKGQVLQ